MTKINKAGPALVNLSRRQALFAGISGLTALSLPVQALALTEMPPTLAKPVTHPFGLVQRRLHGSLRRRSGNSGKNQSEGRSCRFCAFTLMLGPHLSRDPWTSRPSALETSSSLSRKARPELLGFRA